MLALAAIVLLGAWLRVVDPEAVADAKPRPDALEYVEGARNLARGDGYWLEIEGNLYPPRYPPGLSVLLAAARPVVGPHPTGGVRVVLALALLAIVATWSIARRAGGTLAAAAAALLVAVSPLDVAWSRAIMSDVPSSAWCAAVALATVAAASRGAHPVTWLAIGAAAGLSTFLRLTNVVLVPAVLAVAVAASARDELRGSRLRRGGAVLAGALAGTLPLLLFAAIRFGSPLASGYAVWTHVSFAPRFAWQRPLGSTGLSNAPFYLLVLAGGGKLLAWPAALLAAIGIATGWRSGNAASFALARFTVVVTATLAVLHVPFFWQDERFLLPALPLLAACAGQALAASRPPWLRAASAVLLALGVTLALRREATSADARSEVDCLLQIDRHIEADAALLLRTNAFLFRDHLREQPGGGDVRPRVWLPVGPCAHRKVIGERGIAPAAHTAATTPWIVDAVRAPLDPDAAIAGVRALLRDGRPVYYATANREFEYRAGAKLAAALRGAFDVAPVFERDLCRLYALRERGPDASVRRP